MSRAFAITKRGKEYDVVLLETSKTYTEDEIHNLIKNNKIVEGINRNDILAFANTDEEFLGSIVNEDTFDWWKNSWVVFNGNLKQFNGQAEPFTLSANHNAIDKTIKNMGNPKCIIMFKDYTHKYKEHFLKTGKTTTDGIEY